MPVGSPRSIRVPRLSLPRAALATVAIATLALAACGPVHRVNVSELSRLRAGMPPGDARRALHARPLVTTEIRRGGKPYHVEYYTTADRARGEVAIVVFDRTGLRFWGYPGEFPSAWEDPVAPEIGREAVLWYREWRRANADVRAPEI